jgi:tetratricopeptide (TPR) repeat protein
MARFAAGLALLVLAGCTAPQTEGLIADPAGLDAKGQVADVPFYPQEEFYCGPAALATVLTWSGDPVTQHEVAPEIYLPGREGTLASDLVAAARRHGRLAVPVEDLHGLLAEIDAGHPVLVFQNLALDWAPRWHFAVAYGYDLDSREIFLRSGTVESLATSLDAFERTWARADNWAIVVLPPDTLPATAGSQDVLQAAVGLEQAKRHSAAATAYATIAERWPESSTARFGEGNARFALGDYAGAEAAYRRALEIDEASAPAWNNLAYALARQGNREAAVEAAESAVRLGGAQRARYEDTLREVGPSLKP